MENKASAILAAALLTGCAAVTDYWHGAGDSATRKPPAREARSAARAPKNGSKAKPADQAMFRRALLALEPNRETIVSGRGRQLLERLKKEYPASPWSVGAAQVNGVIDIADELARQNKELKAANDSLAREVEGLNRSIEQMKQLERELEKSR